MYPSNKSIPIDNITQVELFSIENAHEKHSKLNAMIEDIEDYEQIKDDVIKYYIGDLHVLDDPSYRIKVTKADKVIREL